MGHIAHMAADPIFLHKRGAIKDTAGE